MASTKLDICNLALVHLGIGKLVTDFDNDRTTEAITLRAVYDIVRDQVLSDFNWPFATKIQALTLIEEDPVDEWRYSYEYPHDCLRLRRLVGSGRVPTRDTVEPHRVVHGPTGKAIYTDLVDAIAEFTLDVNSESRFTSDFVMAFSLKLATIMAPRITAGDNSAMVTRLFQNYAYELSRAQANASNEGGLDIEPDAEYIRARS